MKRRAHLHVAAAQVGVRRIARDERLEQLQGAGRIAEDVLAQQRETAMHLREPRRSREFQLESERARLVLEPAETMIRRREQRHDARGRRAVIDEGLRRLQGGGVHRLAPEQRLDVRHGLRGIP